MTPHKSWIAGTCNAAALAAVLLLAGCGSGNTGSAPVIVQQPASQTVPLGSTASFSVVATGTPPLVYQWSENGRQIAGATAATYTTGILAASDTGSSFAVSVKNGAGDVVSSAATITLGPRSPKAGDLRFQQVDAASTVNGYAGSLSINFSANQGDLFAESTGAPMSVGVGCAGDGTQSCYWLAQVNALPPSVTGLSVGYGWGGPYSELESGLTPLQTPQRVITGLDIGTFIDASGNAYGVSFMQTSTGGDFDLAQYTVSTGDLQAAIAAEGAKSRVVTAISWNGTQVTFLSYGWTGDTSTTYETSVLPVTYSNVDKVAMQMAQAGYIITACGGDAYTPNLWMVGTKVAGDTLPRPMLITGYLVSPQPILDGGYAIVGLFSQNGAPLWWVGEK